MRVSCFRLSSFQEPELPARSPARQSPSRSTKALLCGIAIRHSFAEGSSGTWYLLCAFEFRKRCLYAMAIETSLTYLSNAPPDSFHV